MTSISHWGMFEDIASPFAIPAGYKLASNWREEMRRPDGVMLIVPDDTPDFQENKFQQFWTRFFGF